MTLAFLKLAFGDDAASVSSSIIISVAFNPGGTEWCANIHQAIRRSCSVENVDFTSLVCRPNSFESPTTLRDMQRDRELRVATSSAPMFEFDILSEPPIGIGLQSCRSLSGHDRGGHSNESYECFA